MTTQHSTRENVSTTRLRLAQVVTAAGLIAGALSLVQTVGHIPDAGFLIPGLEDGSEHVHYHLARETMVTLGGFAVILMGLFAQQASRIPLVWWAMLISGAAYVAAMWSGVVVAGEAAPSTAALVVHTIASLGLMAGILLARPAYRLQHTR